MRSLKRELEFEEVTENRREYCQNYSDCLKSASLKHMKSFSCQGCENYVQGEKFIILLVRSSFDEGRFSPDMHDCGSKSDLGVALEKAVTKLGLKYKEYQRTRKSMEIEAQQNG